MTNKITKIALVSTVILGGLIAANEVQAATANKINGRADIEFKSADPTTPVDPVDPENPDPKPIDPTDPTDPLAPVYPGGALRLNHIPTISFGVNKVSATTSVYNARLEKVIDTATQATSHKISFLEVADERGTSVGWHVKAQSDGVFKAADGSQFEAAISLKSPTVRTVNNAKPEASPVATSVVTIGKDNVGTASVLKAEAKKGYGKWQVRYGKTADAVPGDDTVTGKPETLRNEQVNLTIANGEEVMASKKYVANIVWSLEDAP